MRFGLGPLALVLLGGCPAESPSRTDLGPMADGVQVGDGPRADHAVKDGVVPADGGLPAHNVESPLGTGLTGIFKLWQAAFGAGSAHVVRVMGSQAASTWVSQQVLTHDQASQQTDALAIAPYVGGYLGGPSEQARVKAMSLTQLMTELDQAALAKSTTWIQDQAAVALQYKVKLVAYEGGQHLAGNGGVENDATINKLFDDANRDKAMGAVYAKYLAAWKQAKGGLFVHFVNCGAYSKWERWGALEYVQQPRAAAPKFDALQTFIETTPAWW